MQGFGIKNRSFGGFFGGKSAQKPFGTAMGKVAT
jgi:hypothetical protein